MARIARIVIPGVPHHVTQRGNRRQDTFFCEADYRYYKHILAAQCSKFGVQVWAYALMTNHVHLILVPESERALRDSLSEAHRWYTREVNSRNGWKGCLWQGRFFSTPLDEKYLLAASRYVELNPVRAGLAPDAGSYEWSSAMAHLQGRGDGLVTVEPLLQRIGDWSDFIGKSESTEILDLLRKRTRTGRPAGSDSFYEEIKTATGRDLAVARPGRKPGQTAA